MKSIRLSLVLYFLVLLGLALLAVSWLVYRNTQETLRTKEANIEALLEQRLKADQEHKKEELDARMVRRAQTLASLAQSQYGFPRVALWNQRLMSSAFNPQAEFLITLWAWDGVDGRVSNAVPPTTSAFLKIQFADDVVSPDSEGHPTEYFQVYDEAGQPLQHSSSLEGLQFTLDERVRKDLELFESRSDDLVLKPGVDVHRVTLKAPVARSLILYGLRSSFRRPPPDTQPRPRELRVEEGRQRVIFIQCAIDRRKLDAELKALEEQLEQNRAKLKEESRAALSSLWWKLFRIGLITFAATVIGGFWLVRLGLAPLARLSDAVSQVSPKDFKLPFKDDRLPGELQPIVERLNQALDQLKRAFAREKQASADISHELRTPLTALLTTIDVALRKVRSSEEYRELLEDCRSSGQQMSLLVERLLALARLDAGVDVLRPRPVDAAVLADQCAALVKPLAEVRGLTLEVKREAPLPIKVDADKLREIVTNLLHNAVEYNRPQGHIALSMHRQNGHLEVEVRDTGIGMTAQAREHIFERFYRADPSRQADGLHAGLGLAIVKGYVDLMGGTIAVESAEGQGSTFRVQLPVIG
jgi:heavy metal sensor kinase